MRFLTTFLCFSIVMLRVQLVAQSVPSLINYQGQIQNPDGTAPPTADYTLTFRIYDAATGGSIVWGPQIFDGVGGAGHGPKIPVVQGYFNVMLGPTDTAGRSLANAFDVSSRFIEITISNRPPIAPRQQVLSGPYALKAGNADKLAGYDWTSFFDNGNPQTGAIAGGRILPGSIASAQLGDAQVAGAKILDGAVGETKLASVAVSTRTLADGGVTEPKLGNLSVSTRTIQNSAITVSTIADSAVQTSKIADAQITTTKLADVAVATVKLADLSVTQAKLGNQAVSTAKLQDGSVTAVKLAPELRPTFKTNISSFINAVTNIGGASGIYTNAFTLNAPGTLKGVSLKAQWFNGSASCTLRITLDGSQYTVSGLTVQGVSYWKIIPGTWANTIPPTLPSYFSAVPVAGSISDLNVRFYTSLSIDLRVDTNDDGRNGFFVATSYEN